MLCARTACTFSTSQLPKVLQDRQLLTLLTLKWARTTTECNFSTSQLPRVHRTWCALYILTWKCASRHHGMQLFISHLATWLCTCRFSEPTVRASLEKHSESRRFYLFARLHLLSSDSFSSLIFSLLLFSSVTLLASAFPSVHIVGSLTSKLPSKLPSNSVLWPQNRCQILDPKMGSRY